VSRLVSHTQPSGGQRPRSARKNVVTSAGESLGRASSAAKSTARGISVRRWILETCAANERGRFHVPWGAVALRRRAIARESRAAGVRTLCASVAARSNTPTSTSAVKRSSSSSTAIAALPQRTSRDVDGLVEVVQRGIRREVTPEHVQHLLPVQPMPRRQSKQLHELPRLLQPPCPGSDRLSVARRTRMGERRESHRA
jgi:hypothetical protein